MIFIHLFKNLCVIYLWNQDVVFTSFKRYQPFATKAKGSVLFYESKEFRTCGIFTRLFEAYQERLCKYGYHMTVNIISNLDSF